MTLREVEEMFDRVTFVRWILLFAFWTLAASATAQAQDEQRAMQLTLEAQQYYRAGDSERAIELLTEALGLHEQPVIVFNLARAYEAIGDSQSARDHFHRYLEMQADAPDRGAVEARIAAIDEQLTERQRLAEERAAADRTAVSERARAARAEAEAEAAAARSEPWPFVVGAVGIATLGGAVALGVVASEQAGAVDPEVDHLTASMALSEAEDFAVVANVGYALGGALLIAGVVWAAVQLATGRSPDTNERGEVTWLRF